MDIAELASRSPTLKRMIEQSERAHSTARMLSLTSFAASEGLLRTQAERALASLPQIVAELQVERLKLPDGLLALASRVARVERRLDRALGTEGRR